MWVGSCGSSSARASPYPARCSSCSRRRRAGSRRGVALVPPARDSSDDDDDDDKKINLKYFSAAIDSSLDARKGPGPGKKVPRRVADSDSGDEDAGVRRTSEGVASRKCTYTKLYFVPVSGLEDPGERSGADERAVFASGGRESGSSGKRSRRCCCSVDDSAAEEGFSQAARSTLMDARWREVRCESLLARNERDRERELRRIIKECCASEKSEHLCDERRPFAYSKKFLGVGPDCYFEPYFSTPKPTYCLGHKLSGPLDEDVYMKAEDRDNEDRNPPDGNQEGDAYGQKDRPDRGDKKDDRRGPVVAFTPPSEDQKSKRSDYGDEEAALAKQAKDGNLKQEIKYFEGALNIFGTGGSGNDAATDRPYFKITKTVTFEKDKGAGAANGGGGAANGAGGNENSCSEKCLGIDSWMQTSDDANTGSSRDDNKNGRRGTSDEDRCVETAKICCDCLKILANSKLGGAKCQRPTSPNDKATEPRFRRPSEERGGSNTSLSRDKYNGVSGLARSDLMKFIAELFLEAIPKEVYARLLARNDAPPGRDEEFEMRIKSYDRGSEESCNVKTCRLRGADSRTSGREMPARMQQPGRGGDRSQQRHGCCPCIAEDPGPGSKTQQDAGGHSPGAKCQNDPKRDKRDDYQTYDCQIVVNGRKILVKLNKSVEDLLLSGTIQDVIQGNLSDEQVPQGKNARDDDGGFPTSHMCPTVASVLNTAKATCNCMDRGGGGANRAGNARPAQEAGSRHRNVNDQKSQAGERHQNAYRPPPNSYDKKYQNDRIVRPVLTSPVTMRDVEKSHRKNNVNENVKNTNAENAKNLYWCNVELAKKFSDKERDFFDNERVLNITKPYHNNRDVADGKKANSAPKQSLSDNSDSAGFDRKPRKGPEYPLQVLADRRKNGHDGYRRSHGFCRETTAGKKSENENCLPLYWDSQYMKFYDGVFSKDRSESKEVKCENFEANTGTSGNRCLLNQHGMEKRVVVSPGNYKSCDNYDDKTPLYLFKISDSKKCDSSSDGGRGYRDYTVASLTSVKLRANPFDSAAGGITCRKCIETLKTISKTWSEGKDFDGGNADRGVFGWNSWNGRKSKSGAAGSCSDDALDRKGSNLAQEKINSNAYTDHCCFEDEFCDEPGYLDPADCDKSDADGSDGCDGVAPRYLGYPGGGGSSMNEPTPGISFEFNKFKVYDCGPCESEAPFKEEEEEEKPEGKGRRRMKGFEILIDRRIPEPPSGSDNTLGKVTAETTQTTTQVVYFTLVDPVKKSDGGKMEGVRHAEDAYTQKDEAPASDSSSQIAVEDGQRMSEMSERHVGIESQSVESIETQGSEKKDKNSPGPGRRKLSFRKSWRWWKKRKGSSE